MPKLSRYIGDADVMGIVSYRIDVSNIVLDHIIVTIGDKLNIGHEHWDRD